MHRRGHVPFTRASRVGRRIPAYVTWLLIAALVSLPAWAPSTAFAATLPTGFSETQVATGLNTPTAMEFAPDGRLFVCEQNGNLRVIKNGALLATPFLTVTVNASGERGLLGVAFDPDFANNNYIYVYYTATSPNIHNRISRFTAAGDVAVAGSEVIIFDLDSLSGATNHNGGAIHFGPDGKLYVAVGDNANGSNAQSFTTVLGKMLRLNSDGTAPADNPFFGTTTGKNRAIWALGFRNPFTFDFQPGTGVMYINDVGQNTWEEIDNGIAGRNYGWPTSEGPTTDPAFTGPVYYYGHGTGPTIGCAITGGVFYNPATTQFPVSYVGKYFFADYCGGWIRLLNPSDGTTTDFASGISSPVDLKVSSDGSLYYLARGASSTAGFVRKIQSTSSVPTISAQPQSRTVSVGQSASFTVEASGAAPLAYQWQRNGVDIAGATSSTYTLANAQASDSGAIFTVRVSNAFGSVTSSGATLTVTANQPPSATITQPAAGTLYSGGETITYAGTGTDPEDGALPASAFTWQVDFHHAAHVHPLIAATSGATGGSFVIPTSGETSADVYYQIILTVRDSGGLTTTVTRDILPRTAQITLATSPTGLQVTLDGQPQMAPVTVTGVVGVVRSIGAPSTQTVGGVTYQFAGWSDGGSQTHSISTPSSNTTYTATFTVVTGGGSGTGLTGVYYDNSDFTGMTVTRIDPTVGFDWGLGAPAPGIGADTFSVRWTGQVQAQFSETYTFYTRSDDGVRLWVDGRLVVNNWTDHSVTENSGTIALVAGQKYSITMEFYENGGYAVSQLSWSSASTPKQLVPQGRLFPQLAAKVNFQPAASAIPAGYVKDDGSIFAARGNGFSYGWTADNTANTRDRNAANSPDQRYDTLNHMQKPTNPNGTWELAVPNGTYTVRIVSGDPQHFDSVFKINAEGTLALSGTPTASTLWFDNTVTVTVTDGRLTLTNAAGASNNKLCFVEITGT